MNNRSDPLTPQEIHRALALHEEGVRPDRGTIHRALLMALALHAAQAVNTQQAARIAELEAAVQPLAAVPDSPNSDATEDIGDFDQTGITYADVRRARDCMRAPTARGLWRVP